MFWGHTLQPKLGATSHSEHQFLHFEAGAIIMIPPSRSLRRPVRDLVWENPSRWLSKAWLSGQQALRRPGPQPAPAVPNQNLLVTRYQAVPMHAEV